MANGKGASYFYAIFGITLVLFVLGLAGVLMFEVKKLSTNFKEALTVEVVLKDISDSSKIKELGKTIGDKPYVKTIKFISKEEAAKILEKDLGENFTDILGYNPLYASFNLNLNESFTSKESYETIRTDLGKITEVKQVNFQTNILETLDKKIQSATLVVLIIAGALLLFSISLIFNTIRLAMFSNRFTIKTEQLFGATKWFIIKPFLGRSILNGFISGLLACLLIAALIAYFNYALPELDLLSDLITFAILFGAIIVFGILISFLSTLSAVSRYLRLKPENLY